MIVGFTDCGIRASGPRASTFSPTPDGLSLSDMTDKGRQRPQRPQRQRQRRAQRRPQRLDSPNTNHTNPVPTRLPLLLLLHSSFPYFTAALQIISNHDSQRREIPQPVHSPVHSTSTPVHFHSHIKPPKSGTRLTNLYLLYQRQPPPRRPLPSHSPYVRKHPASFLISIGVAGASRRCLCRYRDSYTVSCMRALRCASGCTRAGCDRRQS